MTLNRRKFITGLALGGAGIAAANTAFQQIPANFQIRPHELLIGRAHAQANSAELLKAGPLGENVVGDAKAPVTIIEYASLTCPHCAAFHTGTYPKLKEKYIDTGKVRLLFREFPLNQLDLAAYMLTRCVDKSKFFPLVDILFKKQTEWAISGRWDKALFNIAKFAGFTKESFDACLKNKEVAKGIFAVRERGDKLNVNSTPTFFINGKLLRGNPGFEAFEKRIAEIIK